MIDNVALMLIGVALGSTQCGFGEASFLALTSFYDSRVALTAWSSGTGLAGIFGFAWVVMFTEVIKLSFRYTLLYALIIPVMYVMNYIFILCPTSDTTPTAYEPLIADDTDDIVPTRIPFQNTPTTSKEETVLSSSVTSFTARQRLRITLSLWPYMVPLFVVYFAEYAMESGVWVSDN